MNSNDDAYSDNETLKKDDDIQTSEKNAQEDKAKSDLEDERLELENLKDKISDILKPKDKDTKKQVLDDKIENVNDPSISKTPKCTCSKPLTKYLCANHQERMAFALCASCGKYLCADCGFVINARNYCEHCTFESPEVGHEIEARVNLIAETNPQILNPEIPAPQTIAELPNAVLRMFTQGPSFFLSISKTPFWLSFVLGFLALAPNTIASTLKFVNHPPVIKPELAPYIETLQGLSTPGLIGLATFAAFFQVLLLDLAYFLSVRGFTNTTANFKESSSVLHFCLVPLVLTIAATISGFELIAFIALAIMIIQCSTATRIFTRANFWQGLLAMLSFIFLISLAGLL